MRHRQHRQPGGRQARQVAEDLAAAHELLHPVLHQVGAGAFHQLHERQLVLQRDLLHAQLLVQPHGLQRAGVDAGIGRAHHAAQAGYVADAGDHAAARHALVEIGVVMAQPGQGAQGNEGCARIEQQRHALARQQLPAPGEALSRRLRCAGRPRLVGAYLRKQGQHAGALRLEAFAGWMKPGFEDGRHGRSTLPGARGARWRRLYAARPAAACGNWLSRRVRSRQRTRELSGARTCRETLHLA
jgi:hypothetical protein